MYHLTKANTEIAALKNYRYAVQRYTASLKQLTVVAYPPEKGDKPVFITFRSVKYMQMLTYWERSPFLLDSRDACQALMKELGLEVADEYSLYYAQLELIRIQVVCGLVAISDSIPT